ncbi:hypothetical protein P4O66_022635 [Electrophorus voltai]|uniref:Uncharacterized protein n=1 Tax=Electrophorus voltai TaxID=2609070 RepID=A0AAD9DZ60_9TELE|nr:hypothetical protein P4O66_022635 [Electrophorus voltai]
MENVVPCVHQDMEYLVLPYGLGTVPSVFLDYINETLREFLGGSLTLTTSWSTYLPTTDIYMMCGKSSAQ